MDEDGRYDRRRRLICGMALPVSAGFATPLHTMSGEDITLSVVHQMMMIDGRQSHAVGIHGSVPTQLPLPAFA